MAATLSHEGSAVADCRCASRDHTHVAAVERGGRGYIATVVLSGAAFNQNAFIAARSAGVSGDGIANC